MRQTPSIGLGNKELYSTLSIVTALLTLVAFMVGFLSSYDGYFGIGASFPVMQYAISCGIACAFLVGLLSLACARAIYRKFYNPFADHEIVIDPNGGTKITRAKILFFPVQNTNPQSIFRDTKPKEAA